MADDAFGDSLFDEFDREDAPTDSILRSKINKELQPKLGNSQESSDQDSVIVIESENGSEKRASDNTSTGEEIMDSETETENISSKRKTSASVIEAELLQLKKENEKLRNLIGTDTRFKADVGPVLEIIYMNQAFARRNHHQIEDFLAHLLDQEQQQNLAEKLPTCAGRSSIVCLAGNSTDTPTPLEKLRQMETGMVMGCAHYYKNFIFDTMGWPLVDYDPMKTDGWYVPYYMQVYTEPLPVDEDEEDDLKPQKKQKPKRSCFNCGGDHSLGECQEQRNQQRIRENMNAFKMEKANSSMGSLKNSRYHEDECDPRFAAFKPGVLSEGLRDAMGLRSHELAPHVYMMRKLGYPPGWLEAAKEETSGLAVFDRTGKELNNEGETVEEGEVSESQEVQPKYNTEKLVDYPGFNVPLPEGIRDEYDKLRSIPMQPCHRKEALVAFLTPADGPPKGRKRKSMDAGEHGGKKVRVELDMDLDDSSQTEDEGVRTATPTLEELEEQQRVLSMQLALSEGDSSDICIIDSTDSQDEAPPIPPTPERPPLPTDTPPVTPQPPLPPTPNRPPLPPGTPPVTPKEPGFKTPLPVTSSTSTSTTPQSVRELVGTPGSGGSVERREGTPVHLEKTPTFNKGLPELALFSQGVSQHIPFENLPDATGNFQKLRGVLADMRSKRESTGS